ncbi:MAG: hypothetical protein WCA06_08150, partial [Terrimicrobiaceae bacterium]
MNTTTECEMEVRPSLNPDTLDKLVGQVVSDLGAAVNGALVVLGDRLGIYSELAEIGPAGSQELAAKTGLDERQLREWLSAQAVGRVYYGFSTMVCTPGSLSQEVGLALGAQPGERRLR